MNRQLPLQRMLSIDMELIKVDAKTPLRCLIIGMSRPCHQPTRSVCLVDLFLDFFPASTELLCSGNMVLNFCSLVQGSECLSRNRGAGSPVP